MSCGLLPSHASAMNDTRPPRSVPARPVTEIPMEGDVPGLVHPEWLERWPWLVQGLTAPGPHREWDFGLFGRGEAGAVLERWATLVATRGMAGVAHARQVHGAEVRVHPAVRPGLHVGPPVDAHVTRAPGLLVAVTVADCVPAFLVAERARVVAVVHAGWRGAAAGILERAVAVLGERFGATPDGLALHLGPSICGACYEVGPEVHEALGEPVPDEPTPVDLPANLARRARSLGLTGSEVTRSTWCTRCGAEDLFSHRGGDAGRQIGFVGVR